MYKVTLSNNFGENSTVSSLMLNNRGLTVTVLSVFGWMTMSKFKTSLPVKRALLLSIYMLFVAFLTTEAVDMSMLSIFFFWSVTFYITEKNKLSNDDIALIALIASAVCNIMAIDVIIHYPQLAFLNIQDQKQQVAAINSIYYVMSASIFIFLVKNNLLKVILLVLPCLAMLIVHKSTCLLAITVSVCFYFQKQLLQSKGKRWFLIGISFALCTAAYFGGELFNLNSTLADFINDVDSGGNGRVKIWTTALQRYASSDLFHILFGNGPQAVSKAINLGGHNDFIEILFDFGLLGIILYLSFWRSLILRIKDFTPKTDACLAYVVSLIIYAAASMFSNFINAQIQMMFFVMFWGIIYNQAYIKVNKQ